MVVVVRTNMVQCESEGLGVVGTCEVFWDLGEGRKWEGGPTGLVGMQACSR